MLHVRCLFHLHRKGIIAEDKAKLSRQMDTHDSRKSSWDG